MVPVRYSVSPASTTPLTGPTDPNQLSPAGRSTTCSVISRPTTSRCQAVVSKPHLEAAIDVVVGVVVLQTKEDVGASGGPSQG